MAATPRAVLASGITAHSGPTTHSPAVSNGSTGLPRATGAVTSTPRWNPTARLSGAAATSPTTSPTKRSSLSARTPDLRFSVMWPTTHPTHRCRSPTKTGSGIRIFPLPKPATARIPSSHAQRWRWWKILMGTWVGSCRRWRRAGSPTTRSWSSFPTTAPTATAGAVACGAARVLPMTAACEVCAACGGRARFPQAPESASPLLQSTSYPPSPVSRTFQRLAANLSMA